MRVRSFRMSGALRGRLARALEIEPGEGRLVLTQGGLVFVAGAGSAAGLAGIQALFLSRVGAQALPTLFIFLGATVFAMSLVTSVLLGRLGRERFFGRMYVALAVSLVLARAVVALDVAWGFGALWVASQVLLNLQMQTNASVAGVVTTGRQAKRLFPLFGTGGILGGIVGGLLTTALAPAIGAANLLLVWAMTSVMGYALVRAQFRRARELSAPAPAPQRRSVVDELLQGYRYVRQEPLLRWMSVTVGVFSLMVYFITFPFSRMSSEAFPDPRALAGFLAVFQAGQTGLALVISLLGGRLTAQFGAALMMQGLMLLFGAGFGALMVWTVFPVMVVTRLLQLSWGQGVAIPGWQSMFSVIPPDRRERVRAFNNGVPGQLGTVGAGVLLLAGAQELPTPVFFGIGLALALVAVWAVARVGVAYRGALVGALRAGWPRVFVDHDDPLGGLERDATAQEVALAGLSSPDVVVRRVAADVVGSLRLPRAAPLLVRAARDDDAMVRAAALRGLRDLGVASRVRWWSVSDALSDSEAAVRREAIDAVAALGGAPNEVEAALAPLLADPDPDVRAHAAGVLLAAHRGDAREQAASDLEALLRSGSGEERLMALEALARSPAEAGRFFDAATEALGDAQGRVRRAAAVALGAIDADRAFPLLLPALGDRHPAVRRAAAAAVARASNAARERLLGALSEPRLAAGVLEALAERSTWVNVGTLRCYARDEADAAERCAALARSLAAALTDAAGAAGRRGNPGEGEEESRRRERLRLLADSLREQAQAHARRALEAVGLVTDREAVVLALDCLEKGDAASAGSAREVLEAVGEATIVRHALAAWGPAGAGGDGGTPGDAVTTLVQTLAHPGAWLRACAAWSAAGADDPRLRAKLRELEARDPNDLVRAVAGGRDAGDGTGERVPALRDDERGKETVRTLATLSTMERILFMRRVALFAELPAADLMDVAAVTHEVWFAAGETIAREGEPGTELFVITSGEVRVVVGDGTPAGKEVARCGPGEYVGEMAIISHEPRMATLVAATEVRALSLSQRAFEELLEERPQAASAVMRVLCARLRESERRPV